MKHCMFKAKFIQFLNQPQLLKCVYITFIKGKESEYKHINLLHAPVECICSISIVQMRQITVIKRVRFKISSC